MYAPSELATLVMILSGLARLADVAPSADEPEPAEPADDDWILNVRTGMYHLASSVTGKARCGWRYENSALRGSEPPPVHYLTCKQCAPERYRRLNDEARITALSLRAP